MNIFGLSITLTRNIDSLVSKNKELEELLSKEEKEKLNTGSRHIKEINKLEHEVIKLKSYLEDASSTNDKLVKRLDLKTEEARVLSIDKAELSRSVSELSRENNILVEKYSKFSSDIHSDISSTVSDIQSFVFSISECIGKISSMFNGFELISKVILDMKSILGVIDMKLVSLENISNVKKIEGSCDYNRYNKQKEDIFEHTSENQ